MFTVKTAAEQVAAHLRNELQRGRWVGSMPGRDRLARELGVDGSTIERALGQLERDGLLESQGVGRRRLITLNQSGKRSKRILIVLYEPEDTSHYLVMELCRCLHAAGHETAFAPRSLTQLKHHPERVRKMIEAHPSEAWIVIAGPRPVLEMLAQMPRPGFALFGSISNLPLAGTGPDKIPAMREAIDSLHKNGHSRIVMLAQSIYNDRRLNKVQRVFLEELATRDLPGGESCLPVWDSTPEGLHQCLVALFKENPPTAILVDDWQLSYAVQNFLSRHKGDDYRRVVCICTDYHPCFKWCRPEVSYFYWKPAAVMRRVVRWANNVARGRRDFRQSPVKAKFVESEASLR
ncbi:hypothetical protein DDZ13_12145 [Coraliomargarita sinensis]|uniref:HTH gntR-type domain-containing protein n=1 Tax=Coraliomargarita sinensis TaxID=2174842 RepID=A0A317ZHH6_9BACT|nr:GntR family transcriptional regulator [Coraliomargarita sinensis]PXA03438.1 hypothetical protein DDZ13_12145 [Coraliomargarita sinensis]